MKAIKLILCLLIYITTINAVSGQSFVDQLDTMFANKYNSEEYGSAVLIHKKGDVIYRKGFGMANIELGVKMKPEHVFQIASITKQFTAISILMLVEQKKLSLEDDITKFLPDYPTQGKTITIHNLLNHTSGIRNYSNMKELGYKAKLDLTPTDLIELFKNQPMDFNPGEKFSYSNSGYVLLGHIIEIVTKKSYADFIQQNIFDKIGMTNSSYGSLTGIIKNRASGYQINENGIINSEYLNLSVPYAAGSIMSTVDDLLKWQLALNNNALISKETYKKAIAGSTLKNGRHINYGYGLVSRTIQGSASIMHGGGMNGFSTIGIYLPEEDLFISILSNCDCNSPTGMAEKIAAIAIGKPYPETKDAIQLREEQLLQWVGAYKFPDDVIRFITHKEGKLYSQREGGVSFELFPLSNNEFFFEDGTISYTFSLDNNKKQVLFEMEGERYQGKEIDKKIPTEKKSITLAPNILQKYLGKYKMQSGFVIEISMDNKKLFAQVSGQPKAELFAEKEGHFFLKVIPAELVFNIDDKTKERTISMLQGGVIIQGNTID